MRTLVLTLAMLLGTATTSAIADSATPLRIQPNFAQPSRQVFYAFRNESDWPDYPNGIPNRGIPVPENGAIPRNFAGFGTEVRGITGGGCFPIDPSTTQCLVEVDPTTGQTYQVMKRRERWMVRHMYTSPKTKVETLLHDSPVDWVTLENGRTCMSPYLYFCILTGQSWDTLEAWMSGAATSCSLKLGEGYKVQIYYQYSRYRTTADVPPFTPEWQPPTVAATSTTLEKPGLLLPWPSLIGSPTEHDWELHPGEDAIRVRYTQSRINPAVPLRNPDTKDPSVTTVGGATTNQIAAGKTKVVVEASECGAAYASVQFTLAEPPDHVLESAGHIHEVKGSSKLAPAGIVAKFPAIGGTTDSNGRWESSGEVVAGEYAGIYQVTVQTNDLKIDPSRPWPLTSKPGTLMIGFSPAALFPLNAQAIEGIRLVGQNNSTECGAEMKCDNHRDASHYGHARLHYFIGKMAGLYRLKVDPNAVLPINDMSLPFGGAFDIDGDWPSPPKKHITHRIGVDVDVNSSGINEVELDDIVTNTIKGTKINEPTIHYRLPKTEIDIVVGDVR